MTEKSMKNDLENIWLSLEKDLEKNQVPRAYRRLDLKKETGIRISVSSPSMSKEILIEIDEKDDFIFKPPHWMGMRFETIHLDSPGIKTKHVRLFLEMPEYNDIFSTVCVGIIQCLITLKKPTTRMRQLQTCLDHWTNFFKKFGIDGLSKEAQMGLFGEMRLLELLIEKNKDYQKLVKSWKGCEGSFYDFELEGKIIEVKTTQQKEPRKIWINNEKQLDERGFVSLYIYVFSVQTVESGAQTLPDIINKIKVKIGEGKEALSIFESKLGSAGYLDIHVPIYETGYIIKKEEAYKPAEGFPRILELPNGVGDIKYSLNLSACSDYSVPTNQAIKDFAGDRQ